MTNTPATNPPSPPAPISPAADAGKFQVRNWWHNGWACRITVGFALLGILQLFQPWEGDYRGAGYSETHWEGNEQVRRTYTGHTYIGGGTAFSKGLQGWIPLAGLAAALYACGRPRRLLGNQRRWPCIAGIVVFAWMFATLRDWNNENEAWMATMSVKPVVTAPAGMLGELWLSLGVAIAGGFFARKTNQGEAG